MKKTHFLQTLYLQKPLILIILIATLSSLPWIGLGDFYTKGEPREANLALYMINEGTWEACVIPQGYADEIAYKPPLNHWLIASFSILFNNGEVTPFLSRLPSTLAFIGMIAACFMFYARRRPVLEAFVACLIVITSFEIHRAAMTTRVDMLLTAFTVCGLLQLYVWWEKKKVIYLFASWILLSFATLSKGPVGVLLPCVIFGLFLLLQKVNFFKATGKCLLVLIPSLIIPAIWYYAAYLVKGSSFLNIAFYENFGRFLGMQASEMGAGYELGHEGPFWVYAGYLLSGFLPWTILLLISLFFIKYSKPKNGIYKWLRQLWSKMQNMDKPMLFSLLVIIVTLVFYSIPGSKRSVYIMSVYPFIAIFIARFFIWLSDHKPMAIKISTTFLTTIGLLALAVVGLVGTGVLNIENLSKRERTLHDIKIFSDLFHSPGLLGWICIILLLIAIVNSIYLLRKKMNLKILMAGFGMMLAINIFMDGFLLPAFKNAYSSQPFAKYISTKYNDLDGNTYVTNNLMKGYFNLYGLNFYLGNKFRNFETELPQQGYFVCGGKVADQIIDEYGDKYDFTLLEKSDRYNDLKDEMVLFRINKKESSVN